MTTEARRWSRSAWWATGLFALAPAGCKGPVAESPAAPVHEQVKIARRCAELGAPPGSFDPEKARVFVELAHVAERDLPDPPGTWLSEHAVPVRSVSNFLVTPRRPTSMPWGPCLDEACNERAQSWALRLQLPEDGGDSIRLEMRLSDGRGAPTDAPSPPLLERTLDLASQQPVVVADAGAAVGEDTLVATAYLLVRSDDLFRLMRCKAEQVGADELRPRAPSARRQDR